MQKHKYSTIDKQKLNNSNNTINIRNLISDHYHKKKKRKRKKNPKEVSVSCVTADDCYYHF